MDIEGRLKWLKANSLYGVHPEKRCSMNNNIYIDVVKEFIKENYEPVDDKPGYVWFSKQKYQIIKIETLEEALKNSRRNKMANAKKCDICGAFYESPVCNDMVRVEMDICYAGAHYVDLCDYCYNRLCEFLRPTIPENYCVERYRGGTCND